MNIYQKYVENGYKFDESIIVKLCLMKYEYDKLDEVRTIAETNKLNQKDFYSILFPSGTQIQLIRMNPSEAHYPSGLKGKVVIVDDAGQIHVAWEHGGGLAVSFEHGDEFVLC